MATSKMATILLLSALVLSLLLLASAGRDVKTDAWCSQFVGWCIGIQNCANVCRTQGFSFGACNGVRCLCKWPCAKH